MSLRRRHTAHTSGYIALLRHRPAFRNLWLGKLISLIGDWFNTIALYEAIQHVTTSARAVALVMVVKTLPMFVMTPFSGPLIDRVDRRVILLACDGFRVLCALGLIVAHATGSVTALYVVTALMMCATGVALPVSTAVLPMVVSRPQVPSANALMSGSWSSMMAIGAVVGGVATAYLGVSVSFVIDAGTYVLSMALFWRLPGLPPTLGGASAGAHRADFRDGLRYLRAHRYVLSVAMLKPLRSLYAGLNALIPLYGTVVFSDARGALYVGILYACRGAGAVVGSLTLRAYFGDTIPTMRRLIVAAFILSGLSFAALSQSTAFWQAALALFSASVGLAALWVFSSSLLQLEAAQQFHGRIFSIEIGLAMMLMAASGFLAGALIDRGIPLDHVVLGFSSVALLPAAIWGVVVYRTHANELCAARS